MQISAAPFVAFGNQNPSCVQVQVERDEGTEMQQTREWERTWLVYGIVSGTTRDTIKDTARAAGTTICDICGPVLLDYRYRYGTRLFHPYRARSQSIPTLTMQTLTSILLKMLAGDIRILERYLAFLSQTPQNLQKIKNKRKLPFTGLHCRNITRSSWKVHCRIVTQHRFSEI